MILKKTQNQTNIFFHLLSFSPVACVNPQWPITCGTVVVSLAAGSVWGTSVVTFEILKNRGNHLSVSVRVTVTPEKIIQPSGDEELLESESVYELFLLSSFSIYVKGNFDFKENTTKVQTSSRFMEPIAFTKQ